MRFLTFDNLLLDSDDGAAGVGSLESAELKEKSDESLRPALFFGALSMLAWTAASELKLARG